MSETVFSKIIKKEIPAKIVFESESVIAFYDIAPLAPLHVLFVHKNPSTDLNDLMEKEPTQVIDLMNAITKWTKEKNIYESGYKVVTNIGKGGGQSVFHTHFHVLSNKTL